MLWVTNQQTLGQETEATAPAAEEETVLMPTDPGASLEQATHTVRELVMGFYAMWLRVIIAALLIFLAVLLGRGLRALLQRSLGKWERTTAITFPNWEVLRSNVINYSRDFPYVWDEVTVNVDNESDLRCYTVAVFERVARDLFGAKMAEPAHDDPEQLARARLAFDVEDEVKR